MGSSQDDHPAASQAILKRRRIRSGLKKMLKVLFPKNKRKTSLYKLQNKKNPRKNNRGRYYRIRAVFLNCSPPPLPTRKNIKITLFFPLLSSREKLKNKTKK